jgi:hypothetical protein
MSAKTYAELGLLKAFAHYGHALHGMRLAFAGKPALFQV